MLGIGAAHQKDANGIAWKQNKDFESLLKRLNETAVQNTSGETGDEEIGVDVDGDKQKKRKRKGNGEDRSERMKTRKESKDHEESENLVTQPLAIQWDEVIEGKATSAGVNKPVKSLPRHRAYVPNPSALSCLLLMNLHSHRARAIAAKNISSKSSAHISEILGVAPTASTSSRDLAGETSERKLTSTNDAEGLEISKITTSTKSLADYFNEKLNARSRVFKPTDSATPSPSSNDTGDKDSYDAPRMGLGSTHLRIEVHSEARVEEGALGLSKFSSLSPSSFLAATSSLSSYMAISTKKEEKVEGARITEVQCEPIDVEDETKKPVEVKRKKSSKRSNGPQTDNSDYQMERSKKDRRRKEKVGKTKEKGSVTNEEDERRKEERRKQKKIRR